MSHDLASSTIDAPSPKPATKARDNEALFAGGGELGTRLQTFDWTSTPLGDPSTWSQSLKTCVRIMLTSRQPIWIGWGEELIYMYNDPYKAIIGGKHPDALGRPTSVVWREIWDVIGPMLSRAMRGVEGTYVEAQRLIMERHGYEEETYYTFSYSPVPNDEGGVGGIICANTDDTRRVIGERQMALLSELAARPSETRTVDDVCASGAAALETNPFDLPFALIYVANADDRQSLSLAGRAGIEADHPLAASRIRIDDAGMWPLEEATRTRQPVLVPLDEARRAPTGGWDRSPSHAAVIPIAPAGETGRAGFLVAGLNPFRLFDDNYAGFLGLVARHFSAGIADADAYQEERRRADALAEIDRAKTAFFSNVSHEFRTPLTLLLGPAEDALADTATTPANRERMTAIHRNALRLLKLVNTLLDFSRIEAGRMHVMFESTDLAAYTAELASSFRSTIERAGLRLTVDAPPLASPVFVDRDMWEKVVLNLLSNAFKHTFDGDIRVAVRSSGAVVVLEVSDTGVGIPPEQVPRIFERFHRVPNAQSRTHEGTGIGLALVQELVRLHQGTIDVESEVGRGTTFRIAIPAGASSITGRAAPDGLMLREPDAPTDAAKQRSTFVAYIEEASRWLPSSDAATSSTQRPHDVGDPGPSTGRILVADDNADMRDYIVRLLREHSWAVEAVPNGRIALDRVRATRPDVIVSDVMMPELDGFGLLHAVRDDPATHSTPVILLSARAGEESRIDGMRAGADDYLVKPFAARELVARISTQLRRARGFAEERRKQEDRERMLAAVERERARLADLFRQVPAAIAVLHGPEHVYEVVNDHYRKMVGTRPLIGLPIRDALPELAGQGIYELLDEVRDSGQAFVGSERLVRVDSDVDGVPEDHYYNFVYQPIRDETDMVTRIFVHAVEVTDIAEAKQSADHARHVAEDANRAKSQFLAAMSHELRTPLNAIAGHAQLLQLGIHGALTPDQDDAIARIQRSQQHLLALINDVLNFAKLEAGKVEYRLTNVPLAEVVSEVLPMIEPQLAARGIAFASNVPVDAIAHADREKVRQVILNLLSNATKFTDRGGRIDVRVAPAAETPLGLVCLRVTDTGIGIPIERQTEIFDPFVQLNRGLTQTAEGTGLGLAISRDLARGMGGDLGVQSIDREGSTFTFLLRTADVARA